MINLNKGRYWDEGIELVSGCTPCSPGCDHCWSAGMTHRFDIEGEPGSENHILTLNDKPVFNGVVITHPDRLSRFNTRKPKVFAIWNDLFHGAVSDSFQYEVYKAMIKNKQNTYLILTKRPSIMAEFLSPQTCLRNPEQFFIWHGLTVCNQQEADEKIPIFLQVPGKKFLSIEPMLGAIDLEEYLYQWQCPECNEWNYGSSFCDACEKDQWENLGNNNQRKITAVILGGETGPGARPLHPDWLRSVRDQCAAAGVPFFLKFLNKKDGRVLDGQEYNSLPWVNNVVHHINGNKHDNRPENLEIFCDSATHLKSHRDKKYDA